MPDLLDELRWRGLLHQSTDEDTLRAHLASGMRTVYCGFDPTADSLTIGNLVPITVLAHFQRAGHRPFVVLGGATGLIGDPSGKEAERALRGPEEIAHHIASQRRIFEALLDFDGPTAATMENNYDWIGKLSWTDALRDIGKHFSVNQMIQRDSVKNRLENREQGISYTEFSYMLLQAYDFLHLYRERGVTIQTAGSDQWGNIVSGVDLIRRALGHAPDGGPLAFGVTAPLLTKSDGGKFGKTETGAIWLTADRTSPYAFYQFWLNADDADAVRFLKVFTFLSRDDITMLEESVRDHPEKREAQRTLAREVTGRLHGDTAKEHAEAAGAALFSGEVAHLDLATLNEVFANVPSSEHRIAELDGDGLPIFDLLAQTSLCKSKREAREHLGAGAVSLNGEKVGPDDRLVRSGLLHGSLALLRRGKKAWHVTRWT